MKMRLARSVEVQDTTKLLAVMSITSGSPVKMSLRAVMKARTSSGTALLDLFA